MRRRGAARCLIALASLLCIGAVASPASAAEVDPRKLVLRPSDVPAGYALDPPNTLLVPNAFESRTPRGRDRVRRSARLTGFRATFIDLSKRTRFPSVGSEASVFRSERGARYWFVEVDRDIRRNAVTAYARSRPRLGDQAWLVAGRRVVVVFWRHRTVFAMLTTTFVSRDRALFLARAQQRRIASALR